MKFKMANFRVVMKSDSLSHHGVDGQKWGVRNGPPYPLSRGAYSKSELNAMKKNYKEVKKVGQYKNGRPRSLTDNVNENVPTIVKKRLEDYKEDITSLFKDANASWKYQVEFEGSKLYAQCAKEDVEEWTAGESNDYKRDMLRLYFYDDLGQSLFDQYSNGSFSIKPTDEFKTKYKELFEKAQSTREKEMDIYRKIAGEALGPYSDKRVITSSSGHTRSAKDILTTALEFYSEYGAFKQEYQDSWEPDGTYFKQMSDKEIDDFIDKQFRD